MVNSSLCNYESFFHLIIDPSFKSFLIFVNDEIIQFLPTVTPWLITDPLNECSVTNFSTTINDCSCGYMTI